MKTHIIVFFCLTAFAFSQTRNPVFLPDKYPAAEERIAISPAAIPAEKKSVGMAILYSALLPGMGELYAGNYTTGRYLTIADAGLILTYVGMDSYSKWQKENYRQFAKVHGGVGGEFNDDYYATIGAYMNIENYNDDMSFQRRFSEMLAAKYTWAWANQGDRKTYRSMWTSSQEANNNLRFVVGALVVNRVISIINAVRLVSAHNKSVSQGLSYSLNVSPVDVRGGGMTATFVLNF